MLVTKFMQVEVAFMRQLEGIIAYDIHSKSAAQMLNYACSFSPTHERYDALPNLQPDDDYAITALSDLLHASLNH